MRKQLSILIPTYNDNCKQLVEALCKQAGHCEGLEYEVIVADDCSTNHDIRQQNKQINSLPYVKYVERNENVGRAAIRNFLVQQSRYDWLLLIDAGLTIPNDDFIRKYVYADEQAQVVCGGVVALGSHCHNLRYRYERQAESRFSTAKRNRNPYQSFRTCNFLIKRSLLISNPLREDIKTYGYEDVLLGKQLEQQQASIVHIDNPVAYTTYEPNDLYINKVEESLLTLCLHEQELQGYSPLLSTTQQIKIFHLEWAVRLWHRCFRSLEHRILSGTHPSLSVLKLYKLGHFLTIRHKESQPA